MVHVHVLAALTFLVQILIAILNRYYNFTNPNDLVYTYWYVAEVATAVYVGNIPVLAVHCSRLPDELVGIV